MPRRGWPDPWRRKDAGMFGVRGERGAGSGERGVRWTLLREEDLLVLLASSRRDEREKVTS